MYFTIIGKKHFFKKLLFLVYSSELLTLPVTVQMLHMKPGEIKVTQDTEISLGSLFRTRTFCVVLKLKKKSLKLC